MGKIPNQYKKDWFASVGYNPHSEGQWNIHMSEARFRVVCCGRRFGKSYSVSQEALTYLGMPNASVAVVGPTYSHADIVFNEVHRRIVQEKSMPTSRVTQYEIRTPWGARVVKKSADKPEGILGDGHDLVIIDEAAVLKEEVWTQYIRPTLSDRRGDALLISTPRGFNYFYSLWALGQGKDDQWESFQNPSSSNPLIDPGEIAAAKKDLPDLLFRQEYGAEFVAVGGMVYPFDPAIHIDMNFYPVTRYSRILAGVDWGVANPSVILLGGVLSENPLRVHVFFEFVKPRMTSPELVKKLLEVQEKFGVVQFFIDESAKDLVMQAYNAGVRVDDEDSCNRDIPGGIAAVASMMENDPSMLTIAPGLKDFVFEITHYKYEDTMDTNIPEKPKKRRDHCMDALRYLIMGIRDSYQPFEPEVAGERMDFDHYL